MKQIYQRNVPKKAGKENVNERWNKIKNIIKEGAGEALGKRKVIHHKRKNNKTPRFRNEIKEKSKGKREARPKILSIKYSIIQGNL